MNNSAKILLCILFFLSSTIEIMATNEELMYVKKPENTYSKYDLEKPKYNAENNKLAIILERKGIIKSEIVKDIMQSVDRGEFLIDDIPEYLKYSDSPKSIGYGATISAPHMHAWALELIVQTNIIGDGRKNSRPLKALDVGSGSGIMLPMIYKLLAKQNKKSKVFGIEHVSQLVQFSIKNIRKSFAELLDDGLIEVIVGDGRKGITEEAPFDIIHVGAAAAVLPEALLEQLNSGGVMIIPVGPEHQVQNYVLVRKDLNGKITKENILKVGYVPLTDLKNQWFAQR